MAARIEDYALLSNMSGSALVSRDGSVDWLCVPRFDSEACLAALLGREEHGCWSIRPRPNVRAVKRRYRPGTMILETDFECDGGAVRLVDFMPLVPGQQSLMRVVEGLDGSVPVDMKLAPRFGYGAHRPWITRQNGDVRMVVAPDALTLRTREPVQLDEHEVHGSVTVCKGQRVGFELL